MLMLLAFLTGAMLGMRFKVFVLIPAIGLIVPAIVAAEMIRGESIATFAVTAILAASCLQIGYLGGAATRHAPAGGSRHPEAQTPTPSVLAAPPHSIGPPPSTAYRG